jgi:hypothetical protein
MSDGREAITIGAGDRTRWRAQRDQVDALLAELRPQVDAELWLTLDAAITALVVAVQRALLAQVLQGIGEQWEFLPDVIVLRPDLLSVRDADSVG